MTQKEKLNKAAFDYVNQHGTTAEWSDGYEEFSDAAYVEKAFISGAEWEHKRLVEKACEWLSNNKDNYVIDIEGETIVSEEIINDFKQAMEE